MELWIFLLSNTFKVFNFVWKSKTNFIGFMKNSKCNRYRKQKNENATFKWRYKFVFDWNKLRNLWSYGLHLLFISLTMSLISCWFRRCVRLAIEQIYPIAILRSRWSFITVQPPCIECIRAVWRCDLVIISRFMLNYTHSMLFIHLFRIQSIWVSGMCVFALCDVVCMVNVRD